MFNWTVAQVYVQSSCSPVWLVCKTTCLRNPAGPWLTAAEPYICSYYRYVLKNIWALPWLRLLVTDLSTTETWLQSHTSSCRIWVDTVALARIIIQVIRYFSVSSVSWVRLHINSAITQCYKILSIDNSINPLNTNGRLLYLKTYLVPHSKHFSSRLYKPINLCCKWHKSLFVLK